MLSEYMFTSKNYQHDIIYSNDTSEPLSYFNIINFGNYKKNIDKISMNDWRNMISNWKVNSVQFLFFLRKMQFIQQREVEGLSVIKKINPDT